MDDLAGKQVLFIAPQFFGYEKEIQNEMRRQGAAVDFLPDRPFSSPLLKAVTRLRRELVLPLADRFFMNAIEAFGRSRYDLIFVVVGEGLSTRTLKELRASFPGAPLVLYMWDALRNRRSLALNLPLFDACHTFDASDAKVFDMRFRPLFFSPGFECGATDDFQYHLSFIGTAHSDRYAIVSNVAAALPEKSNCYWYLYLQAPWVFWAHKLMNSAYRGASIKSFHFDPLSKEQVQHVFFNSRAILDIEHPNQIGLTMRTFETMGASKKLITTNQLVRDMDFFNPNNILVIDRHQLQKIPDSFLQTPYAPLADAVHQKYSIKGWLDDILSHSSLSVP
ncbi:CgeB family protein [Polaromonas glacialis]|uniref:hypothetical protein n=1 Tax=Polaromonas glacialis TaxID=866564 RepID=UPI0004973C3B|nr:hypothetical protein [Polaromonas glacialis]